MSERFWRKLLRVTEIDGSWASFVIPGIALSYWAKPVTLLISDLPKEIVSRLAVGYRCFAQVKLLNEHPLEVEIQEWEID